LFYGRFLIAISIRAPTRAIATMIATTPAAMYISVGGKTVTGAGEGVGAASSTEKAVTAWDGQYDSVPAKVA
jgi:hypothetical protein